MFFILCKKEKLSDEEWVPDFSVTYDTPQAAAAQAKANNDHAARYNRPNRWRVRKVVDTDDDNFYAREAALNHTPVPWNGAEQTEFYPYHCAHVHPNDPKKVRFFRSLEDAICGKYSDISMSRYLTNFLDWDEEDVAAFLIKHGYYDGMDFGITQDADKIIQIYNYGPTSCMNDEDEYPLPEPHPAIVYSKGDLAVAYIGNGEEYSARAVVWPAEKAYYTVYGNSRLLRHHLEELGYSLRSSDVGFVGAKVGIFYEEGSKGGDPLMPYVDGAPYGVVSDCGEFMELLGYSDSHPYDKTIYEVRSTGGFAYED